MYPKDEQGRIINCCDAWLKHGELQTYSEQKETIRKRNILIKDLRKKIKGIDQELTKWELNA